VLRTNMLHCDMRSVVFSYHRPSVTGMICVDNYYTVSHNYGTPTKSGISLLLGHIYGYNSVCLSPVINLSTTLTYLLTYLLTNILTSHFVSRSLMVSVGVSALGTTSIHFIEPGVKVNGQYYPEDLMQKLLPDIRQQYCNFYVFQQDSAPAHRARETIEPLTNDNGGPRVHSSYVLATKQSGFKSGRL